MKRLLLVMLMMASPVVAQSNQDYVVRFTGFLGDLRFPAEQMRADFVAVDDDTGRVAFALDEAGTASFAQFTRLHVNQPVTMFICGAQVASPLFSGEIENGFYTSDAIERDLAQEMVDALNGLGECPD
jgi:preprotein translocase subunit SecD